MVLSPHWTQTDTLRLLPNVTIYGLTACLIHCYDTTMTKELVSG